MGNDLLTRSTRALWFAAFSSAIFFSNAGAARADCDAGCQASFITAHNGVRARVSSGVEPGPNGTYQPRPATPLPALTWGSTFAGAAQAYSNACVFEHSQPAQRPNRGENLHFSGGAQNLGTPASAVGAFESESVNYTYGIFNYNDPAFFQYGHYLQLVWANTAQVACGVTSCANVTTVNPTQNLGAGTIVVCQYSPAGNYNGQAPYPLSQGGIVVPAGILDIDGNGQYDALTDGVLILRYLFGMTGTSLTANALAPNATRNTPALVLAQLALVRANLDVDGNGKVDALTDGLLIFRYLSGSRGAALVTGAVASGATRVVGTQVEPYIASLKP